MRGLLLVIAGPTAVGKSQVAIELAIRFKTEIISFDARQIFRELNIGVARPAELNRVAHHFIASHPITGEYNAAKYGEDAHALVDRLSATHDVVVACGGSGLYLKALLEGLDDIPGIPDGIRDTIAEGFERGGLPWLQRQMREMDPELLVSLDEQNPRRLARALEVKMATGRSIRTFRKGKRESNDWHTLKVGLTLPRSELYLRIDRRVDEMMQQGLADEARILYPLRKCRGLQTVGYQELFDYFEGKIDLDEAVHSIKRNTRRYAKRQLTWFRKDPEIRWFDPGDVEGIHEYALGH